MRLLSFFILLGIFIMPVKTAAAGDADVEAARVALFEVLADYDPGSVINEALRERLDDAATRLEQAAGRVPDLKAETQQVTGQWQNLFSSQGIVGEIDLSFMTRALPGGGRQGGMARSLNVTQELRPADHFYRNMMVMSVGEEQLPMLYIATAGLDISPDAPNLLEVRFKRIEFLPARADVTLAQLREALLLPPDSPLAIDVPVDRSRPGATSAVVYLDNDIRINRGKDYFAILRKIR